MYTSIANQKKYFSIIRDAALEGALPAEGFGIIADNIALNENNTQVYGTHIKLNNGNMKVMPLLMKGAYACREAIGLCSMGGYLRNFKADSRSYYL